MGLGSKLNKYVTEEVIKQLEGLPSTKNKLKISVNLSPVVTNFSNHLRTLVKIIKKSKLTERFIFEFEITEKKLAPDNSLSNSMIKASSILKESNIQLSLDDFGIAYLSIGRLAKFNFSTIKIDKSFVQQLSTNEKNQAIAIIEAIVHIANELDMDVIAEGAETKEEVDLLKKANISIIQGYYFYKPQELDDLISIIAPTK